MINKISNLLKLSFKTIAAYKVVFLTILLSQAVGCVTLLGMYSFLLGSLNSTDIGVFDLKFSNALTLEEFEKKNAFFTDSYESDNIIIYLDNDYKISASLTGVVYKYPLLGEPIDWSKSENQVVAPQNAEIKIGESIELFGKEYLVVGKSDAEILEINYTSLPKTQQIYGANIIKIDIRSKRARIRYASTLSEIFSVNVKTMPELTWRNILFRSEAITLWLPAVSVLISFLLGYSYIVRQRMSSFEIYRLLGQSRRNLTAILTAEIFALTLIQYLLSVCLYLFFDIFLLEKLKNLIFVFPRLSFSDYIAVGLFYVLLTGVVSISFILRTIKKRREKNAFT